jgi:ABC-type antimicrobial peptide transport system permease subunit
MIRARTWCSWLLAGVLAGWLACPAPALGCAACFGKSDSPLAAGMNWGILSLLGVIVSVLGGVAGFFAFLARRAARMTPAEPPEKAGFHT